jgi:hypothetical protein
MNHSITVGDILLTLGLVLGGLGMGLGALAAFAGGMSDAPEAGAEASKQGCIGFVVSAVVFGGCLYGLLR